MSKRKATDSTPYASHRITWTDDCDYIAVVNGNKVTIYYQDEDDREDDIEMRKYSQFEWDGGFVADPNMPFGKGDDDAWILRELEKGLLKELRSLDEKGESECA